MKAKWMAAAAGLLLLAMGCTEFNPSGVRARMSALVRQNKFQEAREVEVKGYPPGVPKKSSEEIMRDQLIETMVNPAEAKFTAERIRTLEKRVMGALAKHDDEAARKAVYECGVTDQLAVNMVVYLAKCAYLNSRVNPATLDRWERFSRKYVDGYIRTGDYEKAFAAASKIPLAAAYPDRIDDWLGLSGESAVAQHADAAGVEELVEQKKQAFYALFATRTGFSERRNAQWDALVQRVAGLEDLEVPYDGFEKGFEPDWTSVKSRLQRLRQALMESDVPEADADAIARALLGGFMALVPNARNGLTTAELNDRLQSLRTDALDAVAKALSEEMAKLSGQRAAGAKEAAGRRDPGAQDAALSGGDAARMDALAKLWNEVLAQQAASLDLLARENAFVAAVSDRLEPDINRILGEGARVLRLYRSTGKMPAARATSLLAASIYMGFDDVANLAVAFGADIDGCSEKDNLERTPYLLALQFGFKGQAESLLEGADTTVQDTLGYGAVHYAIRGNAMAQLLELLKNNADAHSPANDGTTPLILGAKLENGTVVRILLGDSDIDATDRNGYAAIHYAAENGNLDIVRTLVSAGAATDKTTGQGADLLELAVSANAEDLIAYLLDELGMKVAERPVSWCVIHGKVLPLKTLVAHGGKITDRHLAAAVKCGHFDMVKYLVGLGCDVNSDAVHGVAKSPGAAGIFDYLYSQGYRD